MAKKKQDFSSAFGLVNDEPVVEEKVEVQELVQEEAEPEIKNELKQEQPQQSIVVVPENQNTIVTFHNPFQSLQNNYNLILQKIQDEHMEYIEGFRKRQPQSEIYANVTVQIRRDLYASICDFIKDMNAGKTKMLNEIFMLGVNEFISKHGRKDKSE